MSSSFKLAIILFTLTLINHLEFNCVESRNGRISIKSLVNNQDVKGRQNYMFKRIIQPTKTALISRLNNNNNNQNSLNELSFNNYSFASYDDDKNYLNSFIDYSKRDNNNNNNNNIDLDSKRKKFAYILSPISDQLIEIERDDLNQNIISNLLNYAYNNKNLDKLSEANDYNVVKATKNECRTIRSTMELVKDDYDKTTKRLLRTCKGLIQVNRCDGFCSSIVQPSIKSSNGFKKVSTGCLY